MSMNVMGMKRRDQIDTMQDVWMAEGLGSDAWTMWMKMMPASMKDEDFIQWAEREGLTNSFPLKSRAVTRTTNKKGKTTEMTTDMEVTELRVEPIAASRRRFHVLDDFRKLDGFVHAPFLIVLIYALATGRAWIRVPAFVYVGSAVTNMFIYFWGTFFGAHPPTDLALYVPLNLPWLVMPLLLAWRLRRPEPFDD